MGQTGNKIQNVMNPNDLRGHLLWLCSLPFVPSLSSLYIWQIDIFIWFYGILIELKSRLKVKCTFQQTLILCGMTEAEPFRYCLINAHAVSLVTRLDSSVWKGWDSSSAWIYLVLCSRMGFFLVCNVCAMKQLIQLQSVNFNKVLQT